MENLDVEKLERKNIYQTPDNVFKKMQENVLQETFPVKQGKIVKLNWLYSAAAAIALLFGLTFFINNDPKETESVVVAQNFPSEENVVTINTLSDDKIETDAEVTKSVSANVPKFEAQKIRTEKVKVLAVNRKKAEKVSKAVSTNNRQVSAIPMDQIVASFTSADLAEVGKNTEQDVYLDLYN